MKYWARVKINADLGNENDLMYFNSMDEMRNYIASGRKIIDWGEIIETEVKVI